MPSLNTKLATAPNVSANYVLKATTSTTIGNSLIFDNGTQVGIGTNSILSGATLEVYNATQGNLFISSSGTNDSCLRFYSGGNELVTMRSTGTGALRIETGTGSPAERLRITATGLVGIGTASPSYRLVVNSGIDGISAGIAGSTYGIRFDNGGSFSSGMSTIHGVDSTLTGSYQPIMINGLDVRFGTSATERMRIHSDGKLSFNMTSATYGNFNIRSNNTTAYMGLNLYALGNNNFIYMNHDNNVGIIGTEFGSGGTGHTPITFQSGGAEKMRIDSSRVLIGQTSATLSANGWNLQVDGGGHASFSINNNEAFIFNNRNTGTTYEIDFRTNAIERGKISVTDSGVSYVTTSDYRVKEDFKEINGLEKVSAIKVYDFKFKDMDLRTDGVIAHELQEVLPYAVTGEKDGRKFQGVDYSKIVPVLVKAIQELKSELDSLKQLVK